MPKRFMAYIPGSTPVIVADTTAPTVPTNVTISAVTNSTFTVSWTASTDNVAVTGYTVQLNGTTYGTTIGSTTLAVSGRAASSTYAVQVQASDAAGNLSALSTSVNATTSALATGGTPVNLFSAQTPSATDATDNQGITLSTRYVSDVDGNVAGVRFYRATTAPTSVIGLLYSDAGVEMARATFGTLTTGWNSVNFTTPVATTAGTYYRVAYWSSGPYVASNGFFVSPVVNNHLTGTGGYYGYGATPVSGNAQFNSGSYFADVSFVVTGSVAPATVPAAPAAPSVGANDSSLSVSWAVPSSGGSTITGYDVQSFSGATGGPVVSVGASPQVTTLTGLTNGTVYTVKVRAKNAVGNGPYSAASAAVTPAPLGAFPDATNTGPKIALTPLPANASGSGWQADSAGMNILITGVNATISGYDIPGIVNNPNSFTGMTVSNCKIRAIGESDWTMKLFSGCLLVDSELGGLETGTGYSRSVAVYCGTGATVLRCHIHHFISGIRLEGGLAQDSWISDLPMGDPVLNLRTGLYETTDHSGGMMTTRGSGGIARHMHIKGGNTACLFVQSDVTDGSAVVGSYLIENCLFENEAKNGELSAFGVDIETRSGNNGPFTIRNNTFSRGWEVGPYQAPPGATITGNVFTDGTPI